MSKKLLLSWLPAILSSLIISGASLAQDCSSGDCPLFIDPCAFDMDYQLFAPAECDCFGGGPEPNTGFYFAYSRMNWAVTRAEGMPQDFDWDKGWGNRFELGFMTEDNCGWLLNYTRLDGPHRINVVVDDEGDEPVFEDLSTNYLSFNSVELDRVWRMPMNCGPGYVEPFVGARWMQFNDFLPSDFSIDPDTEELIIGRYIKGENNMVGGQVGFRWFTQRGRWVLSSEAKVFGGYNWQYQDTANRTFEEGVIMGDVRIDASFIITREVALTVGAQAIHFPFGIGRADNYGVTTNEDLTMAGVTFGLTINR